MGDTSSTVSTPPPIEQEAVRDPVVEAERRRAQRMADQRERWVIEQQAMYEAAVDAELGWAQMLVDQRERLQRSIEYEATCSLHDPEAERRWAQSLAGEPELLQRLQRARSRLRAQEGENTVYVFTPDGWKVADHQGRRVKGFSELLLEALSAPTQRLQEEIEAKIATLRERLHLPSSRNSSKPVEAQGSSDDEAMWGVAATAWKDVRAEVEKLETKMRALHERLKAEDR